MTYDMDTINERIEELEALKGELSTENETELETLQEFVKKVRNCLDTDVVDAILEYYSNDSDVLETVGDIINGEEYSVYEDAEEYGKYLAENLEPEIPGWIENYIDFEQFAQDSLSGSSYTETDDGQIIVFW